MKLLLRARANGLESAELEDEEEFQMGTLIRFPEAKAADCVPADEEIANGSIAMTDYLDAVASLHGIIELSPRTAHQIMRRIIAVYRSLATVAHGDLE